MTEYACDQCDVRFESGSKIEFWVAVDSSEDPSPVYRFCGGKCMTLWQIQNTRYRLVPNIEPEYPQRNK